MNYRFGAGLIAIVTAVGVAAAEPSADEIVALDGRALFTAANKANRSEFSLDDVVRITEKLTAELKSIPKDDHNRYAFDSFFEEACHKSTTKELSRLIRIYAALEPDSFERSSVFEALAARWIHEEMAGINPDTWSAKLVPEEVTVPDELKDVPEDLIAAWKMFKAAMRAYDKRFQRDSGDQMISFQSNERAFYRLVDDLLMRRGENLADQFAAFEWGGHCGTGSDSLYHPRSISIFMALLREHQTAEAVGAALRMNGREPLTNETNGESVRIEFLKKCGLDWESLLVGAQLDLELKDGNPFEDEYVRELAAYGSDHAAQLVAKMALRAQRNKREQYTAALAAFVRGSEDNGREFGNRSFSRIALRLANPFRGSSSKSYKDSLRQTHRQA